MENFILGRPVVVNDGSGRPAEGRVVSATDDEVTVCMGDVRVSYPRSAVALREGWTMLTIDQLERKAVNAFRYSSFDNEKRAASYIYDKELELSAIVSTIPEHEREPFIRKYSELVERCLNAEASCASSAVVGPARFPTAKNNAAMKRAYDRLMELKTWAEQEQQRIEKRRLAALSPQEKDDMEFEAIRKGIEGRAQTIRKIDAGEIAASRALILSALVRPIETLANNGKTALVGRCLELLDELNQEGKPIATKKHSVWKLLEKARKVEQQEKEQQEKADSELCYDGLRIVQSYKDERIRLFFDEKPDREMIKMLKGSAFHWTPSLGCWQRKTTPSAINATSLILKHHKSTYSKK